jgi:cysteine desulfurase / selenocysteine lyase
VIDVARARAETPGCAEVLHFNNAGASLMPAPVLEAIKAHLDLEARIGGYEAARRETPRWERAYDAAAALLGASREEIACVENATRAWDMAFYSVPLRPGDRILTAQAEYVSNYLAFLQVTRRTGAVVDAVPSDGSGQLDVAALRAMMDARVKLIAVTHVPTNGGLVNPVEEIGRIAREAGVLYLVDACQSVGQFPVDVERIGCDLLSGTGRKFLRGPRGTGFLYVRRSALERLEPPFVDMHAARWASRDRYTWREDARRFENWESNCATKIGLAVALDYAMGWGIDAIWARVEALAARLRERLAVIPGVTVRDLGSRKCGIVTLTVKDREPVALRDALLTRGINTSVSLLEDARLDMEARDLASLLRASVHYYNTDDEIERFAREIEALAR